MKKILVLTDFSDTSRQAAEYGVWLARLLQAEIILLHVYQLPLLHPDTPCRMDEDDLQKTTVKELNLLAEDLREINDRKISISTQIRTGTFFVELMYACAHVQPYLVIMGSYGNTAAKYFLWGSHTVYAMKHLPYPLLAVPSQAARGNISRVCFAFDGHPSRLYTSGDRVATICQDLHAMLDVICIDRKHTGDTTERISSMIAKEFSPLHPTVHFIQKQNSDRTILSYVEKNHIDLLMIIPTTPMQLDIFYQGNVRQFISHSNIPVLSLPQFC